MLFRALSRGAKPSPLTSSLLKRSSSLLSSSSSSLLPSTPALLTCASRAFAGDADDVFGMKERKTISMTFVDRFGHKETYDDMLVGQNLLDECWRKGIPIPGECNGQNISPDDTIHFGEGAQCTTCYVTVPRNYLHTLETPLPSEKMQMYWIYNSDETHRCSCKIWLTPDHDGMVVGLPLYKGIVGESKKHDDAGERRHH